MNFYEQELRKLAGQSNALTDPKFVGRVCYGRVSDNIRAKIEFDDMVYGKQYDAIKVTLLNNSEGVIDSNIIYFEDIWGAKKTKNFPEGKVPYISTYREETAWYAYKPTPADYEILANSMDEHLEMFSEDINIGQSMT